MATIIEWMTHVIETVGPLGLGIITFIESLIAPIPSEAVLMFAGITVDDNYTFIIYIIAATTGSYLGTLPFYILGRKSKKLLYRLVDKWGWFFLISRQNVEVIEAKFKIHGPTLVFTGRLIPTVRSLISIPAGISDMNFGVYTLYTMIGSGLWNTLLIGSGYLLSDHYEQILNIMSKYEKIVIALVIITGLIYLAFITRNFIKHK